MYHSGIPVDLFDQPVHPGLMSTPAAWDDAVLTSGVRAIAWCVLGFAGLIEAVYSRHAMQSDGISYLDMGDAILRGDWKMAINGHWSPFYPWMLGVALRLFRPTAYSEFTIVHFVNFLIYLFALGSFDILLRAVLADRPRGGDLTSRSSWLPEWVVLAMGYAVFLWSSLSLITMSRVGPDLLMAGFLYLALALLLRLWARPQSFCPFVAIGLVLGLGYLAKAPMFPISSIFFAIGFW
jgi:hypothetical protein